MSIGRFNQRRKPEMSCKYLPLLLIAVPALCFGTNVPTPTTSGPNSESSATANSLAGSASFSAATSSSQSESAATALSNANQSQTAQGGTAAATTTTTVDGNNASQSITYARQAPSVAQGGMTIVGCGAGGSAGGSNTSGAAFLGIQFVTPECHGWTLAQTYLALGDRKAACQVANSQKAAKRAKKRGAALPDCDNLPMIVVPTGTPPVSVTVQPATVDLSAYALKTEVAESQKRQTERMVGK